MATSRRMRRAVVVRPAASSRLALPQPSTAGSRGAFCAAALMLSLALLCGVAAAARRLAGEQRQVPNIVLQGDAASPGACLLKDPASPPSGLRASAKDGKLQVQWQPPGDNACVDTYIVDLYDPTLRSPAPIQSTSTDGTNATFDSLSNGKEYVVKVSSYSAQARGSGTAELRATPSDKCDEVAPGNVQGLSVVTGQGVARVCWTGIDNDACVDDWHVSATRQDAFRSAGGSPADVKVSKAGCANISRLVDGARYTFAVAAYNDARGEGPKASVTAVVGQGAGGSSGGGRSGYQCKKMPSCRPGGFSTLCSAMGCDSMQRWGACRGPGMYDVDFASKTVTQWCSDACPCDVTVASVTSPIVWGWSSGLYDAAGALLGLGSPPASSQAPPKAGGGGGSSGGSGGGNAVSEAALSGATQGFTKGIVSGLQDGKLPGSGLFANVAGTMLQNSASAVVDAVGKSVGDAATTLVSSVLGNAVDGVVGALTTGPNSAGR